MIYNIPYRAVGAPIGDPASEFFSAGLLAQSCNGGERVGYGIGAGVLLMERKPGQPIIKRINVAPAPCAIPMRNVSGVLV